MKITHIAAHMGDGAGKAIGGIARLGRASGVEHRIVLLEQPRKLAHIEKCRREGVEVLPPGKIRESMADTDVVVFSWWGGAAADEFLRYFPEVPCRFLLWSHKNGFYDPPLPDALVRSCDGLIATSPLTLSKWPDAALVYGFGDFAPEQITPKRRYDRQTGRFVVGYLGMPGYKRFPAKAAEYFQAAAELVPDIHFVFAGEPDGVFREDLRKAGMENRAEFCGWIADVYAFLRKCDAFGYLLRPDTSATTENSVLEAMAAGLPIAMSEHPVGRYVLGGRNGLLFQTPREFARALRDLSVDEALRRTLGRAAREYAVRNCDARENLKRFQDACLKTCQKPKKIHRFGD